MYLCEDWTRHVGSFRLLSQWSCLGSWLPGRTPQVRSQRQRQRTPTICDGTWPKISNFVGLRRNCRRKSSAGQPPIPLSGRLPSLVNSASLTPRDWLPLSQTGQGLSRYRTGMEMLCHASSSKGPRLAGTMTGAGSGALGPQGPWGWCPFNLTLRLPDDPNEPVPSSLAVLEAYVYVLLADDVVSLDIPFDPNGGWHELKAAPDLQICVDPTTPPCPGPLRVRTRLAVAWQFKGV